MNLPDIVSMLIVILLSVLFMWLYRMRGHSATKGFLSGFFFGTLIALESYVRGAQAVLLLIPIIDLIVVFVLPPLGDGVFARLERPDGFDTFIKYMTILFYVGESVNGAIIAGFALTIIEILFMALAARGQVRTKVDEGATVAVRYVRTVEEMSDGLGDISRYVVIATILIGFSNVVQRYLGSALQMDLTNNAFIEVQWYLYSVIFLFGFAFILKNQINVRVDFWFAEQPKKTKARIDLIGHFLALLPFTILALWATWRPVLTGWGRRPNGDWGYWEVSPDPSGLARAPLFTLMIVAFVTLLLQAIAEVVKLILVLRDQEDQIGEVVIDIDAPLRIE